MLLLHFCIFFKKIVINIKILLVWICSIYKTKLVLIYVLTYSVCTLFYVLTNCVVLAWVGRTRSCNKFRLILKSANQRGKCMSCDLKSVHNKIVLFPTKYIPITTTPLRYCTENERENIFSMISWKCKFHVSLFRWKGFSFFCAIMVLRNSKSLLVTYFRIFIFG